MIAQTDNVAGVRIPKFEQHNMSGESKMNLTGLGKGGQQVQQCRKVGGLLCFCENWMLQVQGRPSERLCTAPDACLLHLERPVREMHTQVRHCLRSLFCANLR